MLMNLKFFKLY